MESQPQNPEFSKILKTFTHETKVLNLKCDNDLIHQFKHVLFVSVVVLHPSQQFFSHIRTFYYLPGSYRAA